MFPVIDSVSPATGSLAGGTLVTITGRGFPTLNMGDTLTISAGGAPCTVVSSSYSTVTCTTGARPANWAAPTPIAGLYPGARGLEAETYNFTLAPPPSTLWRMNTSAINQDTNPGAKWIVEDKWELPYWNDVVNYTSRSRAFFTAPRAGDYRFVMAADDYGHLNGTWIAVGASVGDHTHPGRVAWARV